MEVFIAFLIFCQALGALVGACTAVWGEITYMIAMRDGRIDRAEREHLLIIGHGLLFGMSLILLSSLGLVIVAYLLQSNPQPALTASYWVLMLLATVVIWVSWALSRRYVRFMYGSAVAFTAWWFLVYLTFGQLPAASFGASVAYFVIAIPIFLGLLQLARQSFAPTTAP